MNLNCPFYIYNLIQISFMTCKCKTKSFEKDERFDYFVFVGLESTPVLSPIEIGATEHTNKHESWRHQCLGGNVLLKDVGFSSQDIFFIVALMNDKLRCEVSSDLGSKDRARINGCYWMTDLSCILALTLQIRYIKKLNKFQRAPKALWSLKSSVMLRKVQ